LGSGDLVFLEWQITALAGEPLVWRAEPVHAPRRAAVEEVVHFDTLRSGSG